METKNNQNSIPNIPEKRNTPCGKDFNALKWIDNCSITFQIDGNSAVLSANKAGLLSLASHLITLAEGNPGDHIHLDSYNSLEEGSDELILEQMTGSPD